MDTIRKFWPQIKVTLIVSLGALHVGIVLGWSSPMIPLLTGANEAVPLTVREANIIASITLLGAMIGSTFSGAMTDSFGRKGALIYSAFPLIICWIVILVKPPFLVLLAARFILGTMMAVQGVAVPMYIGEIAETEVRGALCSAFQIFLLAGETIIFATGFSKNYYAMEVPGIVFSALLPVACLYIPESPFYLISFDEEKAAENLKSLRSSKYNIDKEMHELRHEFEIQRQEVPLRIILSNKANRRSIKLGIVLMLIQQFTGISAVILYAEPIFLDAAPELSATLCAVLVGCISVCTTTMAGYLIDKAGRKPLLITSSFGMSIAFFILASNFGLKEKNIHLSPLIALFSLIGYFISFGIGWASVPWVMIGELFSMRVKRLGTSSAVFTNFFSAFLVSWSFGELSFNFGNCLTFYIFVVICFCSAPFVWNKVPETKNKTFLEIQQELGRTYSTTTTPTTTPATMAIDTTPAAMTTDTTPATE